MDIWKEGSFLDFWSVIHLVDGMFLAGLMTLIGFNFEIGLAITIAILLLWEFIEPPEVFWNKILDVVVSLIGFFVYVWAGHSELIFVVASFLAVSLNFWAWVITGNYKKLFKNI